MGLGVDDIYSAADLIGVGATIPMAFQRVGEAVQDALHGEYGVLGVKIALRCDRLPTLQKFKKFSSFSFAGGAFNSACYAIRSAKTVLEGKGDLYDWFSLLGAAMTFLNVATRSNGGSILLRKISLLGGLVLDGGGFLGGIFLGTPWYQNLQQLLFIGLFNASPREWRFDQRMVLLRRHEPAIRDADLRANFDMRSGKPTLRVELEDGSYYMRRGSLVKINANKTVHPLSRGQSRSFSITDLNSGQHSIYFEGRYFDYNGMGKFTDDFGHELRSIKSGKKVRVYPEAIVPYPADLQTRPEFYLEVKGERRRFVRVPGREGYFTSTEIWRYGFRRCIRFDGAVPMERAFDRHDQILIRYDAEIGGFRLAEGVERLCSMRDDFFYDGRRFKIVRRVQEGNVSYILGEKAGDRSTRVALRRRGSEKAEVIDHGIRVDTTEKAGDPWCYFTVKGKLYQTKYQDGEIVYALREGGQGGIAEDWYVGRIVKGGFGPESDSLVSLNYGELHREFERKERQWLRTVGGVRKRFEEVPRDRSLHVESKIPDRVPTQIDGNGVVDLDRYRVVVDNEHTIELFLPPEGKRVYRLDDWLRMLKRIPKNTLEGTQKIIVSPSDVSLGNVPGHGSVAGDFAAAVERCRLRDGSPHIFRILVHEIMGHGTERLNLGIERMQILAMKLDKQTTDRYGASKTIEHLSRVAEIRSARPDLAGDYEYNFRLIDLLANLRPRDVEVAGATVMWRE